MSLPRWGEETRSRFMAPVRVRLLEVEAPQVLGLYSTSAFRAQRSLADAERGLA